MIDNKLKAVIFLFIMAVAATAAVSTPAMGKSKVELLPMITVTQVYDDNIFLDRTNKKSDYTTTVSPQIGFSITSETNNLRFNYAPTFVYYNENSDKNTVRHRASLNLGQQFGKFLKLNLSETYYRTEQPFEIDRETQIVRRTRNTYERSDASASVNYRFGPSENLSFGYNHSLLENEDPSIDDGITRGPFAKLSYWFNANNEMELDYRYTEGEFNRDDGFPAGDDFESHITGIRYIRRFGQRTTVSINYGLTIREFKGASEDYRIHNSGVGFSHTFSARTSLSANIGYFIQERDVSGDTDGLSFSTSINRRIERGNISFSASAGQTEEFLEAERRGFTRYRSLNSRFNYQLLKKTNSYAGISYRHNSSAAGVEDETYQGTLGLRMRFYQYFSAGMDYAYRKRNSDNTNNEYVDNRVTISVSGSRAIRSGY